MNIKRVETKAYTEHMYCECGGEMKREECGYTVDVYPLLYYHTCDKCGKQNAYHNIYPRIVYEEVEVEE